MDDVELRVARASGKYTFWGLETATSRPSTSISSLGVGMAPTSCHPVRMCRLSPPGHRPPDPAPGATRGATHPHRPVAQRPTADHGDAGPDEDRTPDEPRHDRADGPHIGGEVSVRQADGGHVRVPARGRQPIEGESQRGQDDEQVVELAEDRDDAGTRSMGDTR